MKIKTRALAGLFAFLLAANASTAVETIVPSDVSEPTKWGAVDNVTNLKHLYFAGQPDADALDSAKSAGVKIVINLRSPDEFDWNEAAAVTARGMAYHNIPVNGLAFDATAFDQIEAILEDNPATPILVHCGSSNRVGGWLATHLVTRHGLTEDQAIEAGRRAGITSERIVASVRKYLDENQPGTPSPDR